MLCILCLHKMDSCYSIQYLNLADLSSLLGEHWLRFQEGKLSRSPSCTVSRLAPLRNYAMIMSCWRDGGSRNREREQREREREREGGRKSVRKRVRKGGDNLQEARGEQMCGWVCVVRVWVCVVVWVVSSECVCGDGGRGREIALERNRATDFFLSRNTSFSSNVVPVTCKWIARPCFADRHTCSYITSLVYAPITT